MAPPMATTPSTVSGGKGSVILKKITPESKVTAIKGNKAMPSCFKISEVGVAAFRWPFKAPSRPGKTLSLNVLEICAVKGGKGTMRSSADMGGAKWGFHLAISTT